MLTLTYTSALFADKNAGTGKTVTVAGIALSGTASSNYTLGNTGTSTTANITQKSLTVAATGSNKIYDATTSATVTLSDNRIAGDVFSDNSLSATFASKTVGIGKTIAVTGIAISGTDAANYSLAGTTASTTATISALVITGSITASNKVYDTNNSANLATQLLSGVLSGDAVNLAGGTATFDTKNVGVGKTVTATGLWRLSGGDSGNYSLSNPTETTTANITAATVNPSVSASNKIYDSTTAATISSRSVAGVLGADAVTLLGGAGIFDTKNVGAGKTVTVTGLSLGGADSGNYVLSSTSATTTANVTAASLTGSITAANKVYDGTTAATILTRNVTGVLGSDAVALSGGVATFDTKNVGIGKDGYRDWQRNALTGVDAGNAMCCPLSRNPEHNRQRVRSFGCAPVVTASNKTYDATVAAAIASRSLTGAFAGDSVTLVGGNARHSTPRISALASPSPSRASHSEAAMPGTTFAYIHFGIDRGECHCRICHGNGHGGRQGVRRDQCRHAHIVEPYRCCRRRCGYAERRDRNV